MNMKQLCFHHHPSPHLSLPRTFYLFRFPVCKSCSLRRHFISLLFQGQCFHSEKKKRERESERESVASERASGKKRRDIQANDWLFSRHKYAAGEDDSDRQWAKNKIAFYSFPPRFYFVKSDMLMFRFYCVVFELMQSCWKAAFRRGPWLHVTFVYYRRRAKDVYVSAVE